MLTNALSTAVAIAVAVASAAPAAATDPLRDGPAYNEAVEREAAHVWRPDGAARSVMNELRVAVEARGLVQSGDPADALARLGADVEAHVARLADCCAGDGASTRHLRMLVAEIADGAQLMRHASHGDARRMGLVKVVQALNLYGLLFEHPDWRPIDEPLASAASRR